MNDYTITLSENMQRASRALQVAVSAELSRHQLLPSEFEVLRLLAAAPGGSDRTGNLVTPATTTASGMSRLTDRLLAQGLVTRANGANDRRVQVVTITAAGRERLAGALEAHCRAVRRVLAEAGLESARATTLTELLADVGQACP